MLMRLDELPQSNKLRIGVVRAGSPAALAALGLALSWYSA
jgi:hypothetical protein